MTTRASRSQRAWNPLAVGLLTSLILTIGIVGLRQLGALQSLELWTYDRFIQWRPDQGADPRLLVVTITEEDLQRQKQYPLTDQVINELLGKLEAQNPKVIGLDIYRDLPVEPGHGALMARLRTSNKIVVVTKIPGVNDPGVPPPSGMPEDTVGFSDIVVDPGGITRRTLLYLVADGKDSYSFPLVVTLQYLADQGIFLERNPINPDYLQLKDSVLAPLDANAGGYQSADVRGYQMLINYRSLSQVARQVTLTEVLENKVDPALIKDRIVLIGGTAESIKDLFYTPYSSSQQQLQKMPGVLIQAQIVSQFLGAVLDNRPPLWYWNDRLELLWIALWAIVGGLIAWRAPSLPILGMTTLGAMTVLVSSCFLLFLTQGWIPVVPPLLALVVTVSLARLVIYQVPQPMEPQPLTMAATRATESRTLSLRTLARTAQTSIPNARYIGQGNRYRLAQKLGSGGMGEVYLALDTVVGKQVALKILKAPAFLKDPALQKRFEREVAVAAGLASDHIIQVSDYGSTMEGFPFYVMEYLRGQTLEQLLKKEERLPLAQAVAIINQVCAGLRLAHAGVIPLTGETTERIKVVHHDLKPGNIFLIPTALGELVKILDFGIVNVLAPDNAAFTPGDVLVTSRYAAPEQWQGKAGLDQRADIYSLGIIFYEMLGGTNPFGLEATATNLTEWRNAHLLTPPRPIRTQPGGSLIPVALEQVILKCLAKDPVDRFASVDDLTQAIQIALRTV